MKFRVVEYWLNEDGIDFFVDGRVLWTGSSRRSAERFARRQARDYAYTSFIAQVQEVVVDVHAYDVTFEFYPVSTYYGVRSGVSVV